MNFSAPLNFPMSFNHPHVYYPQSHPYPQQSDQIPISKLLPKEVQRPPHQDSLYNQLWVDDQNLIKYDPVKKIKDSGGYGVEVDHPPGLFLNPALRSETIKNKNMTSSFHTGNVSGLNYLDPRIPPNQKQGLNKVLNPRSEPKPAFETEPENSFPINPRAFPGYDNRFAMHPMAAASVHANSIREWPANFPQQFSSNQMPTSVNQLNLLQNLQLQMANSQKAYEMMMAKGMNPLMQGQMSQMNYNVQQLNAYRQAQNEQLALAMAFNAQNQLRLEQEAQRKQVELAVTSSMPVKEQSSMLTTSSKTQIEPMMFEDFPEIPLDHSFFPDLYMLGNDSPFENPALEDFKARDFDDSDDKKTAATSVSTSHVEDGTSKEVSNFYNFDFQPFNENLKQAAKKDMQQVNPKKQQQKFLNPDRQKKDAENASSLLKKRDFEVFENGGKNLKKDKTDETNKEKKKTINPKIQVTGVSKPRISDDILQLTGYAVQKSPIGGDKIFHSLGININMPEAGFKVQDLLKPVSNVDKLKKAKIASPASSSKEIRPIKKEKKLTKLSEDLETKQEELKKLYSFPIQPETKEPEQKIEKTRVGRGYQVPVRAFDFTRIPEKKERTIKSVWNPSVIESEKIKVFFTQLQEIFGQEVKKEEAALKILRGTGMDVDSTVDILRRNTLYFKAILFPEPKPEKTKRSYWSS